MEDLKSTLETYRLQLAQIESAIAGGQQDEELFTLQDEMKQLISLTEESVLSYEKSQLLSLLNDQSTTASDKESSRDPITQSTADAQQNDSKQMEDAMASFYADIAASEVPNQPSSPPHSHCHKDVSEPHLRDAATASHNRQDNFQKSVVDNNHNQTVLDNDFRLNEEFLETIENLEDITGVKCQAPYGTEWSGYQYHNSMIMSVVDKIEVDNRTHTDSEIFVKVLFLNPVLEQMKPCPYYLDGSCKFSNIDCKFSHGHTVNLYDLRKFKEPDFSNFVLNSSCLAKHTSGIWQPAKVEEILDDHQYTVKFLHQNLTSDLSIDDVLPMHCEEEEDSSDSDLDEDDDVVLLEPSSTEFKKSSDSLAGWEEHTKGFGSRMLMKYGYKMGEGLGKDKHGRVEPAPVVVLPAGKSLDHCMKLKERKLGVTESSTTPAPRRQRHTVFNFLNKTLGDKKSSEDRLRKLLPRDSFGINKKKSTKGPCKIKVELVKNDSKIKQLKEKIRKYKDSIARNRERDPGVAKKQQAKLEAAMAELRSVQSNSRAIELHQQRADTHRKMTSF